MCGRPKCAASARAIVPLPLAAGPSTAMTERPCAVRRSIRYPRSSARALTGAYAYGKARRRTPGAARRPTTFYWRLDPHGEARMGHQAHLPQVLDPLLRSRQGRSGALHRMRHGLRARAGAEVEAAAGVRSRARRGQGAGRGRRTSPPRIWRSTRTQELSADEEVDLETGDDDLGVETAGEDDES